ncbi:MAG: response regulator [Pirellulales bacterium]
MRSTSPPLDSPPLGLPAAARGAALPALSGGLRTKSADPPPRQTADDGESGALVLIVEDDPRGARLLAAHLQSTGYRVEVAHSAEEARKSFAESLPDLLLCDVCLPDTDGIELTRELRANPRADGIPIALITSSDDRQVLSRGLDAGADDFLSKPVNALELRTRVRSLLRSKRLADELRGQRDEPAMGGAQSQPRDSAGAARDRSVPLIAIIEDAPHDRRLLEAHLAELQFETCAAASASAGLALVRERQPDLVVLDLLLPDLTGYELISAIKNDPACGHVPILVVSGLADLSDRVKALELGADDFIIKGFDRLEFEARTGRLLRLKRSLDQLNNRCDEALRQSVTDSLTGLYTHGFMRETLHKQLQLAERHGYPYSAIFGDIDHFKQINDTHGHAAGDQVLQAIARTLSGLTRGTDTLVRYGGEEFVALLPQTDASAALLVAERMREAIAELSITVPDGATLQVTMSLGVASYPHDAADGQTLVQRGDAAMYQAKQSGRNRVVSSSANAHAALSGACVLLVGDQDKNLLLLHGCLTAEGYRLLHAHDGGEALELCLKDLPDLIVMDAMLPRLTGFDVCRRLKQDSRTQAIPVLMITTPASRDDKLRAIEAGADEFISKPIDRIELVTRVRTLVRNKRDMDVLEDAETVVFALARAVEDRDPLLANHMERVADYAVNIGQILGLGDRDLKALRRAGRVHDIGKIAISDAILFKTGPLTDEERALIREHSEKGYRLLVPLKTFGDALPAVRFHHERLDGSGYPLGLRGDEVPLLAQILAVADIYDALTAQRHYRNALSPEQTLAVLREQTERGLHDRAIVDALVGSLGNPPTPVCRELDESHVVGAHN